MKQAPTLIDRFYRASFSKDRVPGWRDNVAMRSALQQARRFVLDDGMSVMLGELATAAFTAGHHATEPFIGGQGIRATGPRASLNARLADQMRVGARLPHPVMWVEYDLRLSVSRSMSLLGQKYNPADSPRQEGWLLRQHPQMPTAVQAIIFTASDDVEYDGYDSWTFPVGYCWATDDTPLPWRCILEKTPGAAAPSEVCTGVSGYKTDQVAITLSDLLSNPPAGTEGLLQEWVGVMRRMWALLSTINDLPIAVKEVRQSRGFLGRGQIRKYLDHHTITLTVPEKQYRVVARKAIAIARRKAHMVRGHWRDDWRHPPSNLCGQHDYVPTDDGKHLVCERCKGRKTWILEHQRGDAGLGFVTHDYRVQSGMSQ